MRRLVDTANVFFGVLTGCFLLVLYVNPENVLARLNDAAQGSLTGAALFLVGLALAAANIALAWSEYRQGLRRRDLEITTEEGVNRVCIKALEQQLLQELSRAPDVAEPAVCMEARGEGLPLGCRLTFKLRRQDDVMRRVDELKKRVREAFLRLIPAGAAIEIVARVQDLVGEGDANLKAESEFLGPKYPVGSEEGGA